MYYYLFESAKNSRDKKTQEKIKRVTINLGIAGENVSPSPARTIDELIDIGLTKGYSTFVAVGSDLFANKIITGLLNNTQYKDKIAFGFIPYDTNVSALAKIIDFENYEQACQNLRFRYLKKQDVSLLFPNKYFITPINISAGSVFSVHIIHPNFEAVSSATDVNINPDLKISWTDKNYAMSKFQAFINKFNKKMINNDSYSQITASEIKIETSPSLQVYLSNEVIAKTPIKIKLLHNYLQIIVNRDKIAS